MSDAGIDQLVRHFGGQVDRDVLASVLAVVDGNVQVAIEYLQAQEGAWAANDPANQRNDGIPNDYMPGHNDKVKPVEITRSELETTVLRLKKLFQSEGLSTEGSAAGLSQHSALIQSNFELYSATLFFLLHRGVEISKSSRPRILACLWRLGYWKMAEYLLNRFESLWQLPEVLRALQLLDSGRRVRALEKKLARMEANQCKKKKKMGQLRSQIHDLKAEPSIGNGTVSGSLAKRVRSWVSQIPMSKLVFYALVMPKDGWKDLADIIHLNPKDFKIDWFLPLCFDNQAAVPGGSVLEVRDKIHKDGSNLVDILLQYESYQLPFTYIRQVCDTVPDAAKEIMANYTSLDQLLWYHEELTCPAVNQIISRRLQDGEKVSLGYGKLMERLLYFRRSGNAAFFDSLIPIAQRRLETIELSMESPVVVLGDASYSMDVAIRTATIIASVLTILTAAELKFFHTEVVEPPVPIRNVQSVIDVAEAVKADQLTAPACALLPYYEQRRPIKCFVVVTDEVENEKHEGHYFPLLFKKYYEEVYPARLVFVSFQDSSSNARKGRMVTALENMGLDVLTFKLDGARPDLTKLDTLLGILSSESSGFANLVKRLSTEHFPNSVENSPKTELRQVDALKLAAHLDDRAL